jgi:hypothetical protein
MQNILEKYQPLVQLETWGEQLMEMYRFFKGLNYQAYFLQNNKLQPLENKAENQWGDSDILFVPSGKRERISAFL